MNTKLLRGATPSLAAAGAVLVLGFLPRGVAAADNEDELLWFQDQNLFNMTSSTYDVFGDDDVTGTGPLSGYTEFGGSAVLPDELQANETETIIPWLGPGVNATFDVTGGDAAIPTGSVIDLSGSLDFSFFTETVEVPGAGWFGLPEITETFFTPLGNFSI